MAMLIESLLHMLPMVLCMHFTFIAGQRFTLRGQSYPDHGLVLIDEIGETDTTDLDPNNGLNCVSNLTTCCSSGLRGEFDFPDGSVVPTLGSIRNGYYRNRAADRNILNRRSEGMVQGLFQCRIRTLASSAEYEEFYIGIYDENSGVPTVDNVSTSGLSLTCTSSGGPATSVTWRKNCAGLLNNATYQQTQTVTQTQIATYQNTLTIDSAVTDRDGVYTCSVTNARGYSNGYTGLGESYEPSLPFGVTIVPSSSPVAGGSLTLMCGSTALTPAYQWFNEAGTMIGSENTLTLDPLLESHSGEYSCLVTDQASGLVGCGIERVTVQDAPTTSSLTPPTVTTAAATDLPPESVLTPPSEVESHCSLVTWRNSPDVSCQDIIGYDVRLFNPDTEEEVLRRVDAKGTFHNFQLLDKDLTELNSTTVQIRIVSSTGVGTYSSPTEVGVYFELKGIRYENNSAVNIIAIGEGDNALLCKTNKQDCCGTVPNRFGEFFYPNGVKVPIRIAGEDFYRNRGDQLIRLNRRSGTSSPTGRYFCEIPDANGVDQKIIINIDAE